MVNLDGYVLDKVQGIALVSDKAITMGTFDVSGEQQGPRQLLLVAECSLVTKHTLIPSVATSPFHRKRWEKLLGRCHHGERHHRCREGDTGSHHQGQPIESRAHRDR